MNAKTKIGIAVTTSFLALAGGVMAAKHIGQWFKSDTPEPLAASPAPETKPATPGEEAQEPTSTPLYQAAPPAPKGFVDPDPTPSKSAPTLPPPPGLGSFDFPEGKPAAKPANTKKYDPADNDPFEPAPLPKVKRTFHEESAPPLNPPGAPPKPPVVDDGPPKLGAPALGEPGSMKEKPGKLVDLPLDLPPGGDKVIKPKSGVAAPPPPLDDIPPKFSGITRTSNPPPPVTDSVPGLSLPMTGADKKDEPKAKAADDKKGPPMLVDLPPATGPTLPPPGDNKDKKEPAPVPLPGAKNDAKDPPLTIPGLPSDKPMAPPAAPKPGAAPELPKNGDPLKPALEVPPAPPPVKPIKPTDLPAAGPKPPLSEPTPATPRGPVPPATDVPAATLGARPDAVVEPEPRVDSYDEEWYYCKPGDTLESISQKFFFSAKYEQALRKYNLDRNYKAVFRQEKPSLGQGDVVKVPPARILERNYPDTIPGFKGVSNPRPAPTGPAAANTPAGRDDLGSPREYTVRREGMTLRDIAKEELRDANQWTRIFVLNREWNPSAPVPVGTRIYLPSGQ